MGFEYYNHALVYNGAPGDAVTASPRELKQLLKADRRAWFLRYTTDYDSAVEMPWWFCVKNTPFHIAELKSKRRNVVKKGIENFAVRPILPTEYTADFCELLNDAFADYRTVRVFSAQEVEERCAAIEAAEGSKVFGAFSLDEPERLRGYLWCDCDDHCVRFVEQHVMREDERKHINAALVYEACRYFEPFLNAGGCLLDGERTVLHDSNFQDYLIKYFGFRRAYCKLHILYRFPFGLAVWLCYPIRKLIFRGKGRLTEMASAILRMEEARRGCLR